LRTERLAPLLLAVLCGCGTKAAPELSAQERGALAALAYVDDNVPPDPSNRFDEDRAAQLFGQRLFFDAGFSGPLLEGDHYGSAGSLGLMGEASRVSCAS
jgi:hypothetical protein